jgi:hypothetical protein
VIVPQYEPGAEYLEPIKITPGDPELNAIHACLVALLPLDAAARSRVFDYLDDRLKPGEEA